MKDDEKSKAQLIGELETLRKQTAELKETQESLREREEHFRLLFDSMQNGFALHEIVCDEAGEPVDYRFLEVNPAFERLTGLRAADLIGRTVREVLPGIESSWIERYGAVALTGEPTHFVDFNRDLDRHFEVTAYCPKRGQFAVTFDDITERNRAEEGLRRSEERMRILFESAPDGMYLNDLKGVFVDGNKAAEALTGFHREELIGSSFLSLDLLPKRQIPKAAKLLAKNALGQPTGPDEFTLHRKDGSQVPVEIRTYPLQIEGRTLVMGIARDISDRVRAAAALEEREARLRAFANALPDLAFIFDEHGQYVEVVAGQETLLYDEAAKLEGNLLHDVLPEAVADQILKEIRATLQSGEVRDFEYELKVPDGRRWFEARTAAMETQSGEPCMVVLLARDITARVQAEETLWESERRLSTLLSNLPGMAYRCLNNRNWTMLFASEGCFDLTGYKAESFVNDTEISYADLIHPDERNMVWEEVQTALGEARQFQLTYRLLAAGGEEKWVWEQGVGTQHTQDGEQILEGFIIDVTGRVQGEREREAIVRVAAALRQAQTRAEMLPIILDQVLDLLGGEGAALALLDLKSGEMVIELGRGAWSGWSGSRLSGEKGVSGRVIATGRPHWSNEVQEDPDVVDPSRYLGLNATACVPLITQHKTIGTLWVGRKSSIAEDEVGMLSAIGDMAANAIHRATLHEQTQRGLRRLNALRQIDQAISASLDLKLTLNVLIDQVMAQLDVDAASVLLLGRHSKTLYFAAGRGFRSAAIERSEVRLGEGYAGRAALERRLVRVPDLSQVESPFVRTSLLAEEGFACYFAVPLIAKGEIEAVLEVFHRAPLDPDQEWFDFLETLAGQAAIAVDNATLFEDLQRSNAELVLAYDATLEGWVRALDLRDYETEGHTRRVTEMTLRLARAMGVQGKDLEHVRRGALLHDVGKIGVPDSILLKPGPLTEEEWGLMRQHPVYAYEWLSPIQYLRPAVDIPYCHHEKWDGSGYPRGIKGDLIPLAARIFAVVDVWDALISDRPYRRAWSREEALRYIQEQSGAHFDPRVVEVFLEVL